MGIPDHLTCLLKNLYAGQEATVGTGTTDWFKTGKSTKRLNTVTLLIKLYAEYIMRNARPDESQTGIKIARKNINNVGCADDTTLNGGK